MQIEIKVPSVGESVTEAILAQWFKQDGDVVHKGEALFVIETDKVTLEVEAEADGVLRIKVGEGETIAIGTVVGLIETEGVSAATEAPAAKPAVKDARIHIRIPGSLVARISCATNMSRVPVSM